MNLKLTTGALFGSLLLGACATPPAPSAALNQARADVRSASLDAAVLTHAPMELKKATDTLNRADALRAKDEPAAEIDSAAYVASQQAKTASAIALAKANDIAIVGTEADRERARADMRTVEAQRAQAQAGAAQAQTTQARKETVAAQASASSAQMQTAQLQRQLAELQAKPTERGMLVTLGDVLFENNRAVVKPGAQASLRKLADFLQQNPERRVLIEGHTDSVGSNATNEVLSLQRADAVDAALVGMGMARQRATTVGYGEDYPVADNATDTNRALNRRVEVYIADNDQPVRPRR
jgi:outer membrane protein OmpA-like peptidoglycan-associated protein